MINVGDVVLLQTPPSLPTSKLQEYVMTVTSVSGNTLTGVNGLGSERSCEASTVSVIATYSALISQFVIKGAELDARVAQG